MVLNLIIRFVFTFTLIWFFWGLMRFPDAPIQACRENSYCGKQGQHRSKEDFENFRRWETGNFIAFPATFLLLAFSKKFNKK